jgi:hypothetical protein
MEIELIVDVVIFILRRYGDDLAKRVGKAAFQVARQIYDTVKEHLSTNKEAEQVLGQYETGRASSESALRSILQQQLEQNQALATTLHDLVSEFKEATSPEAFSQIVIKVEDSGGNASRGGVAAGKEGYAAGHDMYIGTKPRKKV